MAPSRSALQDHVQGYVVPMRSEVRRNPLLKITPLLGRAVHRHTPWGTHRTPDPLRLAANPIPPGSDRRPARRTDPAALAWELRLRRQ